MKSNVVSCRLREGVAVLTIDHPPVNATSQAVRRGLLEAVEKAIDDTGVLGVVIAGAHGTFSAGGDVNELGDPSRNAPSLRDVIERIESSAKPVVAALSGYALGGGLELALGCHFRVGMAPLRVGLPEVTLGVIPGAGGTQRLPLLIGAEAALDVMISGRHLQADEAIRLGILDVLVDHSLEDAAVDIVKAEPGVSSATNRWPPAAVPQDFFLKFREVHRASWNGLLAPWKIVDAVENLYRISRADAAKAERAAYLECQASPQRGALGHVFNIRRKLRSFRGTAREADISKRLSAAIPCVDEWTVVDIETLAAAGMALIDEGLALSADEIDLASVDSLGFPAHLGGPMFFLRTSNSFNRVAVLATSPRIDPHPCCL